MAQGKPEGQVYVMVSDLGGLAKIGWSKDPDSRRSALRGATGLSDLRLAWSHTGSRIDERTMHLQFGPMRVFGEWFQYGPPLRELVGGLPVTSRITSYPSVTSYGQSAISRLVGKKAARRRAIPVAWDLYAQLKYLAAKRSRASKSVVPVQDVTDEVIRAGLEALGEWIEDELDEMGLPTDTPDSTEPVGQAGRCTDSDD